MAREHGVLQITNDRAVVGMISCRCGWRHVNAQVMSTWYSMDNLLDEYNAHRARCSKAKNASEG